MMKPYPYVANQSPVEKLYNYRLFKCRRVIENAFGQLKARFREIGRGLQVSPKNVNIIIRAYCILHNFLKIEDDEVFSAFIQDAAEDATRRQPNHITRLGENDLTATAIRNAIAMSFQKDAPAADVELPGSGEIGSGDRIAIDDWNECIVDFDMF
ncbi:PREDICTED: uncharacterized protein LOC108967660 [Bactrocera latifrons]|uniref:uncharacterized protein LOC108967660 n=1 Tax=Bactrocera latifrons TaxID=174628 RepID=UPI0008DCF295|nr:PREDICTED: uncharacterized protein LOC108967660 [Bactrocera latifrons]